MEQNKGKAVSNPNSDDKNVADDVTIKYNSKDDINATKNKKMVNKKQHHDPYTTIKQPYKFEIPGGRLSSKEKAKLRN